MYLSILYWHTNYKVWFGFLDLYDANRNHKKSVEILESIQSIYNSGYPDNWSSYKMDNWSPDSWNRLKVTRKRLQVTEKWLKVTWKLLENEKKLFWKMSAGKVRKIAVGNWLQNFRKLNVSDRQTTQGDQKKIESVRKNDWKWIKSYMEKSEKKWRKWPRSVFEMSKIVQKKNGKRLEVTDKWLKLSEKLWKCLGND